ncbi:MAG TPA: NAD-dependent epimerase/dehydratase family protein [Lacipirellulaceae bacterium]|nr:NAD-dependent epimerase/dehydratase family protein [Lacipirellulaceae bacterium]
MNAARIIFGCGYLGRRVGNLWCDCGDHTIAVSRQQPRGPDAAPPGLARMHPALGDVTRADSLRFPLAVEGLPLEAMLYAVGYDRTAAPDIHAVYAGGLRNVLAALPRSVTRVIYISTTGVYGAAGGEWVDEQTPPAPLRDGGIASLAAEQILAAHPLGRRSAVLRLAGIYGPGRVPHLDKLRTGEPLPVPHDGWLNLIHVDDAARVVVAAEQWLAAQQRADGPHLFCVSDGAPVSRAEYYREAARLVGAPPPRFVDPPAGSPAAARAAANRRVSNAKMVHLLGDRLGAGLAYPSYREGLASILQSEA